jgi:glycosyltransferase involved in cell wall biosynthesis
MPKISVLLTSFNHAQYLQEAIDSVLTQTFTDFELIIMDDASTDESWYLIQSYTDPRITKIRNLDSGNITSKVIDVISNVAQGEYIAIHHSDDVWEIDKLEKQVTVLIDNPNTCAVFTHASTITEDGTPLIDESHFYFNIFDQPNRNRYEWLRYFFSYGNALCHPSALIRKKCFEDSGYYATWMWQLDDFDLWVRFAAKFEIYVIPEKLIRFRVKTYDASPQVSGNYRETRIRSAYEIFHVLDNYRQVSTFEELYCIFPEAKKYHREQGGDVLFVLGLTMLELTTQPFVQLFALQLLHEAITDPVRAQIIQKFYSFDSLDFVKLTGQYDVFLQEKTHKLDSDMQILNAELKTLQIECNRLKASIVDYNNLLSIMNSEISEKNSLQAGMTLQLTEREAKIANLVTYIETIHRSHSWRMTSPLRFIRGQLNRFLKS